MNLDELSEVNFGLALEGRIAATLYKPEWFSGPYGRGIEVLQRNGASREDVAKVINSNYISDAHNAVKRWNGIGEQENFDWLGALQDAYKNSEDSAYLKKVVKKLEENEPVDWLPIYGRISSRINQESFGLVRADDINENDYRPFQKTGWDAIDNTIGGIPSDGPIIIIGTTGTGKSTFAINLLDHLLHTYPEKTAAIYTLEMSAEHYKWRAKNMYPSLNDIWDRLFISGSVHNVEELVAEISMKKPDYVALDDMDNIVSGNDASEYERVYRRVKEVCRFMKIPFFVLCQPNRAAKIAIAEKTKFLGLYDAAWSGSAENSAALYIALQKVNGLDWTASTFPTVDDDMWYMMFWKSRDGWPGNYDGKSQCGPGAVIMEESKQMWRGRPYGGRWKLWPVDSGGGTKKKRGTKRDE